MPHPDSPLPVTSSQEPEWAPQARACYSDVVRLLESAAIPFTVGGGFAFHRHTGIWRTTKDLDLFLVPGDVPSALQTLRRQGFETWIEDPIWLAKAQRDGFFVDLIAGVGNATLPVNRSWIENSIDARILDIPCKALGAEEMIAAKTFVTRRERFDGADIAHLVKACGARLDWERLARLVAPHQHMLYWHLILFAFIYPAHTGAVPEPVWRNLAAHFHEQIGQADHSQPFRGALIDPKMFAIDVNEWGERDLYAEFSAAYPSRLDSQTSGSEE